MKEHCVKLSSIFTKITIINISKKSQKFQISINRLVGTSKRVKIF